MKPRKLFLFRVVGSNQCGAVRARTIEEAADLLMKHVGQSVEIYRTPNSFSIFIPPWL